jgi:asparagine N-glycosylation enzyme membrane subunit Stt3
MMPLYSFNFLAMIVFAVFFYRAAEFDNGPGLLWTVLSILISLLVWQWLGWGLLAMIFAQVCLFVGIGAFRAMRKS